MPTIKVICHNCGKKFDASLGNYKAGELFCSDKCRLESYNRDIKIKKLEELKLENPKYSNVIDEIIKLIIKREDEVAMISLTIYKLIMEGLNE
jgi:endogenous inhibitor of DNA gyrase (YacG/DUF329 family)